MDVLRTLGYLIAAIVVIVVGGALGVLVTGLLYGIAFIATGVFLIGAIMYLIEEFKEPKP